MLAKDEKSGNLSHTNCFQLQLEAIEAERVFGAKIQELVSRRIPDLELPSVLEVRPRSKLSSNAHITNLWTDIYFVVLHLDLLAQINNSTHVPGHLLQITNIFRVVSSL